ncbi:MAG TPA: BMP family ABC transporter substrate-binding protein [Ilumatobacteraceae bacterium]|nr:BMP family ABC transporter substrate-binding protein [Ilumatobacteraceae bacterium]
MIKSKRVLAAALVAALGLTAAACGDDDDEGTTETAAPGDTSGATTPGTEPQGTEPAGTEPAGTEPAGTEPEGTGPAAEGTTVGLLFDITGRGDRSFNDSAAAGLDQAVDEFGVVPSESTPTGDADRADRLNLLVGDGNQLVIGVGFLWEGALEAGAIANPDTHFALVDGVAQDPAGTPDDPNDDTDLPNVANLLFAEHEGSFLVGAAAALTSTTGKIGFVGGVEIDLIKKFEAGFIAGATAVNPDIEILSNYASQPPDFSGFNAPNVGLEIATQMYADGADVIYHAAGGTGLGVFQAATEAGAPGEVWAIGVDSDQWQTADPAQQPYILTSMLKRVDVAVYETIKAEAEGAFAPGIQVFDLSVDGVGYATSGDNLSADTIAALEDFKAQIIAGDITVPEVP